MALSLFLEIIMIDNFDLHIKSLLDARLDSMKDFSPNHRALNMYGIFRRDLDMSPGKMLAQAGHAFSMSYDKALIERPDITAQYKGTGNGTKISMYSKNLGQLLRAYKECIEAHIPCELIIDRGHILLPHFDGKPIITALGIGPAYKDEVEFITKRYTMMG